MRTADHLHIESVENSALYWVASTRQETEAERDAQPVDMEFLLMQNPNFYRASPTYRIRK